MNKNIWYLLETEHMPGFENMQFDLQLLEKYILENSKPILRFYSWEKITLSIGRNQKIEDINLEQCKKRGIDVVKRPTGGKAVLHQGELTYSIVGGRKDHFPVNIFESYKEISKAIILGLEQITKDQKFLIGDKPNSDYKSQSFCFSSSTVSDINYAGKKIVGSAQYRKGDNFLQHGTILINQDFSILKSLFNHEINTDELVNLSEILGFTPSHNQVKDCIIKGFKEYFSVNFEKITS